MERRLSGHSRAKRPALRVFVTGMLAGGLIVYGTLSLSDRTAPGEAGPPGGPPPTMEADSPPAAIASPSDPSPSLSPPSPSGLRPASGGTRAAGSSEAGDIEQEKPQVALTFDDGPDLKYTPQILDILKEYGVRATFFVVGPQAENSPDVLKRIQEEGHTIGSHSWGHADLSELDADAIIEDLERTDALIEETTGVRPRLFRAPYGALSDTLRETVEGSGRELAGWNVDTRDWDGTSADKILKTVQDTVKPGGVILMHSFGGRGGKLDQTVKALPDVIEYLRDSGYALVGLDELQ